MEAPAPPHAHVATAREEQLAALREEIDRAGQVVESNSNGFLLLRFGCLTCFLFGFIAMAGMLFLGFTPVVGVLAVVITLPAAFWTAWRADREYERREAALLESARRMEPERVASLLHTLAQRTNPEAGVRKVARDLLRDLNLPTELTPAGTPVEPAKCNK